MIADFLKDMIKIYPGEHKEYLSWVLREGKVYNDQQTLKKVPAFVQIKACFQNSYDFACINYSPHVKYIEGYYLFNDFGLPLEHAWNTVDGKLVDTTSQKYFSDNPPCEWFGIEVDLEIIKECAVSDAPDHITPLPYYYETRIRKSERGLKWKESAGK